MPKSNTDKFAERRAERQAAREQQRQKYKKQKEEIEMKEVISPEDMNEFLMNEKVNELYFLHGVSIPKTNYEKDQMWRRLLLFSEFDGWCYQMAETVMHDSEYPQTLYPADIEESMFPVFIHNIDLFLERAKTFTDSTRTRILLYALIVARDYMSVARLNAWKQLVGL